uniref:Uncharacterized protein n=1 Tax=Ciona savignyi TaxID=51511 RepID=H2ZB81_CIOSA
SDTKVVNFLEETEQGPTYLLPLRQFRLTCRNDFQRKHGKCSKPTKPHTPLPHLSRVFALNTLHCHQLYHRFHTFHHHGQYKLFLHSLDLVPFLQTDLCCTNWIISLCEAALVSAHASRVVKFYESYFCLNTVDSV